MCDTIRKCELQRNAPAKYQAKVVTMGSGCEQAGIASPSAAREKGTELIWHQKAGEELQPCGWDMKETESFRERTLDTV